MANELTNVEAQSLSSQVQTKLDDQINALIEQHKSNDYELNKLALEGAMILTSADKHAKKKAAQNFLTRLGKNISGANNRSDNEINQNLVEAQYAAQKVFVKLAEQNLLSFKLISRVRNELDTELLEMNNEINEIYKHLLEQLKQNELLRWAASIRTKKYDGTRYQDLDNATKITCVVRDFFNIMQGTRDDLNWLETALNNLGLEMIDRENFIQRVGTNAQLHTHLLGGDSRLGDFATENEEIIFDIQKAHETNGEHVLKFLPEGANRVNANDFALKLFDELKQLTLAKKQSDEAEKLFLTGYIAEALPPLDATTNAGNIKKRRYMLATAFNEEMLAEENLNQWEKYLNDLNANISEGDACSILFGVRIGLIPKEKASNHLQTLMELADAGDVFAQYELAHYEDFDTDNKLKYMQLAADQGYFLAAFDLGKMYYYGLDGAFEDNEQAHKYFKIAAKSEQHINSILYLGDIYWNGFGVAVNKEQAVNFYKTAHGRGGFSDKSINNIVVFFNYHKENLTEAVKLWIIGAKRNFPKCLANLGRAYYNGRGVEAADWVQAADYFKRAIAAGEDGGLSEEHLGHIYWNGCNDISVDKGKAVGFYKTAYDRNNFSDDSINNIAIFYDEEENNPKEAADWWSIGAEKNFPQCLMNLGRAYYNGRGVEAADWVQAADYFKRAIAAGEDGGLSEEHLGHIYWNGGHGVDANKQQAINFYEQAYWRNNFSEDSINKIGNFYHENKDRGKALGWWSIGANRNFPTCLANLGMVHRYGYGVNKNWAKAVEYFEQAIAAGNNSGFSEKHLGDIYFEGGDGITQDYEKSVTYYEKAIAKRRKLSDDSKKNLAKAAYHLGNDCYPTDKEKAIEWYKKAGEYNVDCARSIAQCYDWLGNYSEALKWWRHGSELESSYCALMAANCYRYGIGTEKNYEKAIEHYKQNIEHGDDSGYSEYQIANIFWAGGYGVTADYSQATNWMKTAANKGNRYAQQWRLERNQASIMERIRYSGLR